MSISTNLYVLECYYNKNTKVSEINFEIFVIKYDQKFKNRCLKNIFKNIFVIIL